MTLPYPLIIVHLGPDLANSTGSLRIGHMARNAARSLQAHQWRSPLRQGTLVAVVLASMECSNLSRSFWDCIHNRARQVSKQHD